MADTKLLRIMDIARSNIRHFSERVEQRGGIYVPFTDSDSGVLY